jgi:hypothetical protein
MSEELLATRPSEKAFQELYGSSVDMLVHDISVGIDESAAEVVRAGSDSIRGRLARLEDMDDGQQRATLGSEETRANGFKTLTNATREAVRTGQSKTVILGVDKPAEVKIAEKTKPYRGPGYTNLGSQVPSDSVDDLYKVLGVGQRSVNEQGEPFVEPHDERTTFLTEEERPYDPQGSDRVAKAVTETDCGITVVEEWTKSKADSSHSVIDHSKHMPLKTENGIEHDSLVHSVTLVPQPSTASV